MKWEHKARIQKICSRFPFGDTLYVMLQKKLGRLTVEPMGRLPHQINMTRWLVDEGYEIIGKTFFEVGTGHIPVVPIGFFLSGAGSVITVDLHRRLDWDLTKQTLSWIVDHRQELEPLYQNVIDVSVFRQRMDVLQKYQSNPRAFFKHAGITYQSPADAAKTSLANGSVDYHFSFTTLEHIPHQVLQDIMKEAKRILSSNGIAIHVIDLSDHFQHQDKTITAINFLRFTEKQWKQIGHNQFSYCNRLRASDYLTLFLSLSFTVLRAEKVVDKKSLETIQQGFPLAAIFQGYDQEDICTTTLSVLLQP